MLLASVVARLPPLSAVTKRTGPDWAAVLAAELIPAAVYVLDAVPKDIWLSRVVATPDPTAVELAKAAVENCPSAVE